jgi:peptide/nickel transport system substrate-binding protein
MKRTMLALALMTPLAFATPRDALVMQINSAIGSLEPAQAVVTYDTLPVQQFFEGLYYSDFGTAKPLLASRVQQSGDGKVSTFSLRRNVKFHDGSAMACSDVEYSLRRTLLVGNETSQAAQVRANILAIGGFTPEVKKTFTFQQLSQIVKCNASGQLVLTLERNVPSLLINLTDAYVVPQKLLVANGDWSGTAKDFDAFMGKDVSNSSLAQKPVGTGAYSFVARDPSRLVLKAFDGYWGAKPALKNVIIQKVDNDTARVLALQTGDSDISTVPDRDTLERLKGVPAVTVYEQLPLRDLAPVMMFNHDIKDGARLPAGQLAENNVPTNFFTDIHARKGFAAAFDIETFTRDALKGKGQSMNTTLPPNSWANDPSIKRPAFSLKTAADELKLAFGGKLWSSGFTVPTIVIAGDGISQVVAGILKQNIEKLNPKFHVEVNSVELSAGNAALFQSKFSVVALTWGGPDPDTVLRGLYSANGILSSAINIKDPKLEALLDEANNAIGQNARKPLYRTILRYLNEQTYAFPLAVQLAFAATGADLKGYETFHKTNLFRFLSK